MSRIARKFEQLGREGRKGFIPFVTAGDPDLETSRAIVLKLAELGADIIELGVPFSDPMADGATIQRSSQRALSRGVKLPDILELARQVRETSETPIVLFSYLNPLMQFGFGRLARSASDAGVDGILVTDVIDAEAFAISKLLRESDLDLISLIAPTTTSERLEKIARNSSGFLYAVSRAGVTGARSVLTGDAQPLVARARQVTNLPIAVGFGISTREQVKNIWDFADAAVVGSAIVAEIEKAIDGKAVDAVEVFVRALLPQFANSEAEL